MSPYENYAIVSSRIWISNPIEVLFKHELGHALGFDHSNKCENEHSFLCSQVNQDNDFLSIEKDIFRFKYISSVSAELTEADMEAILADFILNE